MEPMTLDTDDANEALKQIAGYLRTVDLSSTRSVVINHEFVGYWQCEEWLQGLLEIADECDRIRKNQGDERQDWDDKTICIDNP